MQQIFQFRKLYKSLLVSVLVGLCVFVPMTSYAQNNYEVRKIFFKGNKTFTKAELLNCMAFHESNIYERLLEKKEASLYSNEFMQSDIERLRQFYQSSGFLNVDIRLDSLKVNQKKQTLNIYLIIVENRPVLVDSVTITIADTVGNLRLNRILNSLVLKKGIRFDDASLLNDVATINTRLANHGYVYSKTDYQLTINADTSRVNINYYVTPGVRGTFGTTIIKGNRYIREATIRRQLSYKPGQRFNKEQLEKTRKQLYDLQLFRIASVAPVLNPDNQEQPIPVELIIQEMPRWSTRFGLGYGTEDRFRAFGDLTFRGLFGGTSRINLYVKHSQLMPYYFSLSWIEPQFLLKQLSLSVNPYLKKENEPGYNTQTIGINFPIGYKFSDETRVALTYYFDRVQQAVDSTDVDIPNPESDRFQYSKSGISMLFSYSNAKPTISPERGWTINMGAKINGYIFGTDFSYVRLWIEGRNYQKFGRFVMATRGMIGSIYSSNADGFIPVEDRFYSGGSMSNRGWGRSMLGPKRDNGTPLGGKSIIEANIEFRHPLFWRIELAAFLDAGNVWKNSFYYRLKEFALTAGGGLRINTPIGPIRFDVGVPLFNEKRSPQFFLSIGQAF